MEYYDKSQKPSTEESDSADSEPDERSPASSFLTHPSSTIDHPKFEITVKRKFEISELCCIFFNKYVKYIYLAVLSVYAFLTSWSFATVAGSAWSINFPFHRLGSVEMCAQDAFVHRTLPSGGCLYAYYISLTIFAAIVITLSLLDLKEQAFVQVTLGLMRFITVALILLYCIVRLGMGGDSCREDLHMGNSTIPVNLDIKSMVVKFDPRGWVVGIPVITFAFLFHTGISSLTQPIKEKAHLHWMIMIMFIAAGTCYLSLGIVVPLWFRASIQETATLNWVSIVTL